jgi:hypothetical protein
MVVNGRILRANLDAELQSFFESAMHFGVAIRIAIVIQGVSQPHQMLEASDHDQQIAPCGLALHLPERFPFLYPSPSKKLCPTGDPNHWTTVAATTLSL